MMTCEARAQWAKGARRKTKKRSFLQITFNEQLDDMVRIRRNHSTLKRKEFLTMLYVLYSIHENALCTNSTIQLQLLINSTA